MLVGLVGGAAGFLAGWARLFGYVDVETPRRDVGLRVVQRRRPAGVAPAVADWKGTGVFGD